MDPGYDTPVRLPVRQKGEAATFDDGWKNELRRYNTIPDFHNPEIMLRWLDYLYRRRRIAFNYGLGRTRSIMLTASRCSLTIAANPDGRNERAGFFTFPAPFPGALIET